MIGLFNDNFASDLGEVNLELDTFDIEEAREESTWLEALLAEAYQLEDQFLSPVNPFGNSTKLRDIVEGGATIGVNDLIANTFSFVIQI